MDINDCWSLLGLQLVVHLPIFDYVGKSPHYESLYFQFFLGNSVCCTCLEFY